MLGRSSTMKISISPRLVPSAPGGFIHDRKERIARADDMITLFNVKTPDADQLVGNLSGGNQQKVVLGAGR